MPTRFYIVAAAEYERARAEIDGIMGLPTETTKTSIDPAVVAPKTVDGRVALALCDEIVDEAGVPSVFSRMAAAGLAAEVTEETYFAWLRREAAGL
jgi:hypothetical protein